MRTVVQTAFLMAVLTLISKILGFIREMILAAFYGTSYITDAYVMSITITGIIFSGILGAVTTSYIPVYSRIKEQEGEKEGRIFTNQILTTLYFVSILSCIIGIVFSDSLVSIFARGFQGETASLTAFYLKFTFCYIIFTSATGVLGAYLQYKGIFLPQIAAGFLQNLSIIAVIIISGYTTHYYLALGILLGTAANFIITAIITNKNGYKFTPNFRINESAKEIIFLAVPVFIGSSVVQINTFVDKALASGLPEGSVSALNYAMLLVTLATSLTTTILITIIYPKISKANSLQEYDVFNDVLGRAISVVFIISIPLTLGAMVYSNQVVQIVYERGAFDSAATMKTSSAFFYYAIGLTAITLIAFLTHIYYSIRDMKTPIIHGVISVIINIALNLILIKPMAHNGLALATSIASYINALLLYNGLKQKYPHINLIKSRRKLSIIGLSSILSVGMSMLLYYMVIMPLKHIIVARMLQLALTVIFAAIVYLLLLRVFKIEEINLIKQIFKRNG
mgnify:CR=1 FL=1